MKLYFAPMTCSLATRIALNEGGLDGEVEFQEVSLPNPHVPKGQVPALVTREGHLLTENAAVLQYVGDLGGLNPAPGTFERYQLQEWLSFVGTELHKHVMYSIFNPASPTETVAYAREQGAPSRFDYLESWLKERPYLVGDRYTVADAYLTTVLNWTSRAGIDLKLWPSVYAWWRLQLERPGVKRAMEAEMPLLKR